MRLKRQSRPKRLVWGGNSRGVGAFWGREQWQPFSDVPYFWSQHYDVAIDYSGHAESWDGVEIDGQLDRQDAAVWYMRCGLTLAVATVSRDLESLQAEAAMESGRRIDRNAV